MISVYQIKPAFQRLLQPILRGLHKMGVTANQLTLSAIFFSVGLGLLVYFHPRQDYFLLLVALGLLLRMALNALDGMMAKQYQMQSRLGEVLNEMGDIISDVAIILPFAVLPEANPWFIVAFAILAVINEFAGLLGKAMGGERRYDGPMGKSDRALLVGLFCIVLFFWEGLSLYTDWIFGLGSLLMVLSTWFRLSRTLK